MKILDNTVFDVKTYWKTLATFVLVITPLQMTTRGAGFALLVPFALIALFTRKAEKVLFWMLCATLLTNANQFFLPKGFTFFVAQRILFFAVGAMSLVQMVGRRNSPFVSPFSGIFVYLAFMAATAFRGWNPTISYLKLLLFSTVFLACYGMANMAGLSRTFNARQVRSVVLAVVSYFVFGSIALIPFPAISQLSGLEYEEAVKAGQAVTSLFKGMTMHSQALGPIMAAIYALLISDFVVNVRKANGLYLALLVGCAGLVYMSSSRTGMGALIAATMLTVFSAMRMRGIGAHWRGKVKSAMGLLALLAVVAVLAVPNVRRGVVRFALKYDQTAEVSDFSTEYMLSSRQGVIDEQLAHFRRSPLIGNGFQVSYAQSFLKNMKLRNLLTAPVEKGVWITTVLEEGGLIGFLLFTGFALTAGLLLLSRGAYTGMVCFGTMLVSNLGELTIFSMTATGGFIWTLVFVGTAFDAARVQSDRARRDAAFAPPMRPPALPPRLGKTNFAINAFFRP